MAAKSFEIEGLSDLVDALQELPKATEKNVLKRVLIKAAQPIANAFAGAVKVRTGHLKRTIGVGTKLTKRQKALSKKESAVEVYAGAGGDPAAHLEEFGSAHNKPRPALRPAWDGNKQTAFESLRDDLAAEIDKAVQRRARKAAKLAAQMK